MQPGLETGRCSPATLCIVRKILWPLLVLVLAGVVVFFLLPQRPSGTLSLPGAEREVNSRKLDAASLATAGLAGQDLREPASEPVRVAASPEPVQETEPDLGFPLEFSEPAPDPLESGECALELSLHDARNGQLVAGDVELWRCDAPGNAAWTAGDQLQASASLENGRGLFQQLPEGSYRVHCKARRANGDDPPAFQVSGPLTRVDLSIELPQRFRVLLDVRDESGLLLDEAQLHPPSASMSIAPPDWIARRRPTSGSEGLSVSAVEWSTGADSQPIRAAAQGLELGTFDEASSTGNRSRHARLTFQGRSSVVCAIPSQATDPLRLVAVSIPLNTIFERVRTQDGLPIEPAQLKVEAECQAVEQSSFENPRAWRDIVIRLRVECAGYARFERDYRLSDGAIPEIVLPATR